MIFLDENSNNSHDTDWLAGDCRYKGMSVKGLPLRIRKKLKHADAVRSGLNPDFTFSTLVNGSVHADAMISALSAANDLGEIKTMYLYGDHGSGKTHLVQSIGNRFLDIHSAAKVRYVTGCQWATEVADAKLTECRDSLLNYHQLDMLIVDDVDQLSIHHPTRSELMNMLAQEQLLMLVDTLQAKGKSIIFASKVSPESLNDFDAGLKSRMLSGIVERISVPSLRNRLAIQKVFATRMNVNLDDDASYFIAYRSQADIRKLHGILETVALYAKTFNASRITFELAQKVLLKNNEPVPISVESIQNAVASFFGYRVKALSTGLKSHRFNKMRNIAMYLAYQLGGVHPTKIAASFGKCNAEDVVSATVKVEDQIKSNHEISKEVIMIRAMLGFPRYLSTSPTKYYREDNDKQK